MQSWDLTFKLSICKSDFPESANRVPLRQLRIFLDCTWECARWFPMSHPDNYATITLFATSTLFYHCQPSAKTLRSIVLMHWSWDACIHTISYVFIDMRNSRIYIRKYIYLKGQDQYTTCFSKITKCRDLFCRFRASFSRYWQMRRLLPENQQS